jgi:hypothetical protein
VSYGEQPTPSASDLTLELEQYKTRPTRWGRSEFNATFSIGFGNGLAHGPYLGSTAWQCRGGGRDQEPGSPAPPARAAAPAGPASRDQKKGTLRTVPSHGAVMVPSNVTP